MSLTQHEIMSWYNSEVSSDGLTKGLPLMSGLKGPWGKTNKHTHTQMEGGGEQGGGDISVGAVMKTS